MPNRTEVYEAIDSERDYQISKWGTLDDRNNIADFIAYMQNYLDRARAANNPDSPAESIRLIRQVSALGVACMEKFGAPLHVAKSSGNPTYRG